MKKSLLTLFAFILLSKTLSAQTGKSHKFLGGSFNFNYDQEGTFQNYNFDSGVTQYFNQDIISLNISPEFGYFLSDKWAIGIQPGYSRVSGTEISNFYSSTNTSNNYSYTNKYHTDIIGLQVNIRYYWMLSNKFGIYPQGYISSAHNLKSFVNGNLNIGVAPNAVFFPTEKIGINLGFGNAGYRYNYQSKGSTVNVNLNNNFNFGVNYYWGGK